MNAEAILFDALRLDPQVASIVSVDEDGQPCDPRIFPDVAPQEFIWPIIVFARSSSVPTHTIHGTTAATEITMNVTCWAHTRPAADALCNAVIAAMGNAGYLFIDRRAGYEADVDGYASAVDFSIWEL